MKNLKYIIAFSFIVVSVLVGAPYASLLNTNTVTLGASSSDTLTISNVPVAGDSLGVLVEVDVDSISCEVRYQYLSVNNKTDTIQFANLPTILNLPTNGYAEFSNTVPVVAGAPKLQYYLIVTNDKASTQTVNVKTYTVVNR